MFDYCKKQNVMIKFKKKIFLKIQQFTKKTNTHNYIYYL